MLTLWFIYLLIKQHQTYDFAVSKSFQYSSNNDTPTENIRVPDLFNILDKKPMITGYGNEYIQLATDKAIATTKIKRLHKNYYKYFR